MWSNARELQFLKLYQNEAVLWNPKDVRHKDRQCLHDAWTRISNEFGLPVAELKKKRDSLMATYRGHKRRRNASFESGVGAESIYKPIWFAFDLMDSFLGDFSNCRRTINTETQENQSPPLSDSHISIRHDHDYESEAENPTPVRSRRRKSSVDIQMAVKCIEETMTTINKTLNAPEDDYDHYAKILANKLRKLPEAESQQLMFELDWVFIRHAISRLARNSTISANTAPSHKNNCQ